ncbi:MAG TPA: hypothetical protein VIL99_16215 [Ignavibacteria bacterium]
MKTIIFILFTLIIFQPYINAQTGFEDADSKSSIILDKNGVSKFNITDASIKIGYLFHNSESRYRFGFDVSGKAENGIASLFENDNIAPNANLNLTLGYQTIFSQPLDAPNLNTKYFIVDDWFTIQIGYNKAQYKLFNPLKAKEEQVQKRNFDGFNVTGYYNILFKYNYFLGVSLGFAKLNNYQSLNEVELIDKTIVIDELGFQRYINKTQKLRRGDLNIVNHILLNFDAVWIPKFFSYRVGIDVFGRYDKFEETDSFTPGLGIFITQEGAPTHVIGGISFSYKDKDLKIGLISGFNF